MKPGQFRKKPEKLQIKDSLRLYTLGEWVLESCAVDTISNCGQAGNHMYVSCAMHDYVEHSESIYAGKRLSIDGEEYEICVTYIDHIFGKNYALIVAHPRNCMSDAEWTDLYGG